MIEKLVEGKIEVDERDGEQLASYFDMLGKTDSLSQVEFLTTRRESLTSLSKQAEEDYKRYGSLYIKIFFMVGILVAVLLA